MNRTWTLHGGPVRWDDCFPGPFVQWPHWGIFTAKPTHSHAVFTLWVYIPTHLPLFHPSAHTESTFPGNCSKWHHKLFDTQCMLVMQILEAWADTKLCPDISCLFKKTILFSVVRVIKSIKLWLWQTGFFSIARVSRCYMFGWLRHAIAMYVSDAIRVY